MSELRLISSRGLLALALVFTAHGALFPVVAQAPAPAATPARPAPTPEQLAIRAASEKDHQRMMDLLGIKQLRHGASSDPNSPYAANYDESKANPYPKLPDPLVLKSGKPVTSAKAWWTKRRPEIVADFDNEILGKVPANVPKVNWEVVSTSQEKVGDVPVVTKKLAGHVDNSAWPEIKVTIDATLTTPAHAAGRVPVMMEIAFDNTFMRATVNSIPEMQPANPGNHTPGDNGMTWQQQVLAKGWGYVVMSPTSFQADNGAGLTEGIIGLVNKGQPRKLEDWGTLRAWAWGASRTLDYLETDPSIDAKQVGIMGHSRFGKTALVAMAYDPRFAVAYISSSGTGGTKLYRHIYGELLENLASAPNFYYWMGGDFLKYAGPLTVADLPVDAHELIALCAPRPLFVGVGASTADKDGWADAKGEFLGASGAQPVYRLLGKRDMGTTELPPIETGLVDGDIAFRQHSGGHTPGPNWPTFLTFASRYLHAQGETSR